MTGADRPRSAACDILRGTCRLLVARGLAPLVEAPLANGRRADVLAIDPAGTCVIIEIKASRADLQADCKWQDYLGFAERFYFAVGPEFPLDLLPPEEGVIVADRFQAEVLREARTRLLAAARRRALLLRFARTAALRLHGVEDPTWP